LRSSRGGGAGSSIPGAEHADQRGFDDMLPVEGLEAGLLIREVQQVAAVLRQETHLQPIVLEGEIFVGLILLHVVQHVLHGIRIHPPLRTLVDAAGVENRRFVISSRRIRRQRNGRFFNLHTPLTNASQHPQPGNEHLHSLLTHDLLSYSSITLRFCPQIAQVSADIDSICVI